MLKRFVHVSTISLLGIWSTVSAQETTFIQPTKEWKSVQESDNSPKINIHSNGFVIGDINADGLTDIAFSQRTRDARTDDLSDYAYQTVIFLGGNESFTPDLEYWGRLVPIGDINNDEYDDFLLETGEFTFDLYTGNEESPLRFEQQFEIQNFTDYGQYSRVNVINQDIDEDGYNDVIMVNAITSFVMIKGNADLSNIAISYHDLGQVINTPIIPIPSGESGFPRFLTINTGNQLVLFNYIDGAFSIDALIEAASALPLSTNLYKNYVTLEDFDGDSHKDLLVYTEDLSKPKKAVLTYNNSTKLFFNTLSIIHTGFLQPMGDLNHDGKLDYIGANVQTNNELHLFYGAGNLEQALLLGEKLTQIQNSNISTYWSETYLSRSHILHDVSGDHLDDFYVTNYKSATEITRLKIHGNADSSVQIEEDSMDKSFYTSTYGSVYSVGDMNGDGIQDFAMANRMLGQIHIYFGGTYKSEPDKIIQLSYHTYSFSHGDFNGDGFQDIAFQNMTSSENMGIVLGGISISETPDVEIAIQSGQYSISGVDFIGDINGDGKDDIAIAYYNGKNASNYLKSSIGLLYGSTTLPTTTDLIMEDQAFYSEAFLGTTMKSLGDVNHDGFGDFVVSNYAKKNLYQWSNTGDILVYLGKESGLDYPLQRLYVKEDSVTWFGHYIQVGDFNNDTVTDILAVQFRSLKSTAFAYVFTGNEDGIFNETPISISLPLIDGFGQPSKQTHTDFGWGNVNSYVKDSRTKIVVQSLFGSHALIFDAEDLMNGVQNPEKVLVAKNTSSNLGGLFGSAIGKFFGDDKNYIILAQENDNNDAYQSSRAYAYPLDEEITATETANFDLPESVRLYQNYPNPFNPVTQIQYELTHQSVVSIEVFNMLGQKVAVLVHNKVMSAGNHKVSFNGEALSSGIYIYRLRANGTSLTSKMSLIK
ncbi:T9SS type A sorting domain-containing protein [bacterium]|nr:MAG: T9SS type A sorting domain-containing protein [bacterium]